MTIGIYLILNKENNNKYVGQSKNIKLRWYGHINSLRNKKHSNPHLQHSWNKYGEKIFEFIVLEECEKENLDIKEQYWINKLKPQYNISLNVFEPNIYIRNDSYLLDDAIPKGTFVRPKWHRQVYGDGKK